MSFTETLPTVNALLNGCATLLLTAGFICIKTGREKAHRACHGLPRSAFPPFF